MAGTRLLLRGHYNPTNWTRKYPNLQRATLPTGERVLTCTACMRTANKPARNRNAKKVQPKEAVVVAKKAEAKTVAK